MIRYAAVLGALLAAGCGKKGPPLAPLIPIPAAIDTITATRVGNDVYVTLTVPSSNVDEFTPAALERIEVYAYTGRTPPPRARFAEVSTLVATVPVAPPPMAGTRVGDGPPQGAQITIVDTLTSEELVQGREPVRDQGSVIRDQKSAVPPDPRSPIPDPRSVDAEPSLLRRFYAAFPWSPRGRPGPPGAQADVPLLPAPEAPASVSVDYDAREVTVTWERSEGLIGFLLERALPEEPLPPELEEILAAREAPPPPQPLLYNVYRTTLPDPFAPPPDASPNASTWNATPPTPISPAPTARQEFSDAVAFNEERCYSVRAVRGIGADARIGEASSPTCVMLVDTFAPASPQGLAVVASEGALNLIWEPSTELDLAGYLVLRGEAPGDTLQPLTPAPVREARYRDAAVTPGVRYVYAVVAVDNRFPVPNVSTPSERMEETAR